jgi:lipopolysaccharide transport system ATP-binding protein
MADIIIKAEGLSKSYIIGHEHRERYIALRDVISNTFRNSLLKTKHIFKGGQLIYGNELEVFWALKDINFEVRQGDRIGIIGKNGAGKSTLLKVLSRITEPTKGKVYISGRVASLLEVGTGFHPELTGKENIFLNGAILGMKRWEIKKKFDEIVDFSGVEKFLDTPVKRYSSGMYVRLAFAVAAHLDPEILIVDEVLAVGDAEFQKKCLSKMDEVSKEEGRTVLFVSHNLLAVKTLCTSGILLSNGMIQINGEMNKVIESYVTINKANSFSVIEKESDAFIVHSIKATNNGIFGNFDIEKDLEITIEVSSSKVHELINVNLFFNTPDGTMVFATCSSAERFEKGSSTYSCIIPAKTLNDNTYLIDLMIVARETIILHNIKTVLSLQGNEDKRAGGWLEKFPGLIRPQYFNWEKTMKHD